MTSQEDYVYDVLIKTYRSFDWEKEVRYLAWYSQANLDKYASHKIISSCVDCFGFAVDVYTYLEDATSFL